MKNENTPVSVKYAVWDMHPWRGGHKQIVSEETHVFPNPGGDLYLRAAGRKYSELMEKWNGPQWLMKVGRKRGCRYEVEYEYLDGHLRR